MPLSITRRFAFLFDARNETRYPPRRQQSSLIIKPRRRITVDVSQSSFLRLIEHRIRITNDEEEDTRSFVSDLLYQVHPNGDERRRARNGFDVVRVVVVETDPFAGREY